MSIKPVNNKILLKKLIKDQNLIGIILPEINKNSTHEGIITALNDNDEVTQTELKLGDHVLYNKYSGQELKINDEDFIILNKEDIIAIIN